MQNSINNKQRNKANHFRIDLKKGLILFIAICTYVFSFAQNGFDKALFYETLSHGKLSTIESQLKLIKDLSGSDKDAFEGAMLMKKASKVAIPAQKLSIFKKGYQKLESAISKNKSNVEYRFLRLMIQENAPKNLGYHKNINEDVKLIIEGKNSVSKDIQNAIEDYSKTSKKI